MESPKYYPCCIHLDGKERYVAWYSAECDGLLREANGRLVVVNDVDALTVPLEVVEPVKYDFDHIRSWCFKTDVCGVDCQLFLNAWNFLDDLTGLHAGANTAHTRLSRSAAGVYEKLFWGNNIPAVTPPGERFDPSWSPEDLATIRMVFESGLGVLSAELACSAQGPDDT